MKRLAILSLVFAFGTVLSVAGADCAQIAGTWAVRENVLLKYCAGGKCQTSVYGGDTSITVTAGSNSCTFSFESDAVDPVTGGVGSLSRSGSISCAQFTYTGPLGLTATGVVYTTNWIQCSGTLKDDQIVFTCMGRATGKVGDTAFTLDIGSTSVWQGGPAQQAPTISSEPADRTAGLGSNITVNVRATGPCLKYQWYRNGAAISGATSSNLVLRRIQSGNVGAYSVRVHNFAGSIMSREARIDVADLSPPTVAFTSPSPGQRVTTNIIRVTGTAADNVAVAYVNLSVDMDPVDRASGTNKWSAFAALVPGTNMLYAQSWDASGFESRLVSRPVFYAVQAPLVVNIDGRGSLQPNLNGRLLEIGRAYTMTAVPASGWLATGWTGGEETTTAKLRFIHEENLALTALFVPNPYPPLAGVYRGLFREWPVLRPESSGAFSLTLAGSGAFSGTLRNAGQVQSFTGRFDATGNASVAVGSVATNRWVINLTIALGEGVNQITGTVEHSGWEAALGTERAVYNSRTNAVPFAAHHTYLVQDATDPALVGAGDGFGTITTTRGGSATLSGRLVDDSVITLSGSMVNSGNWPLYQSLYSGRGCLFGWLRFHTVGRGGLGGSAYWIRPANSNVVSYPHGFTNFSTIIGSAYRAPARSTDRVLALKSGRAVFSGKPLVSAFTNVFTLSARGVVTNLGANKMTLTINPATGLVSGSVRIPGASGDTPVKGAVLQNYNLGSGILATPWANARLTIEAAP